METRQKSSPIKKRAATSEPKQDLILSGDIISDLPKARIEELALQVYHELQTSDAIVDLGLFRVEDFPDFDDVLSVIEINFTNYFTFIVAASETQSPPHHTDEPIRISICYSDDEVSSCLPFVEARIIHELTHAVRFAVVLKRQNKNIFPEKITPPKDPRTLRIGHGLYKLEQERFHSGYWMEHRLLGGIIVCLTGTILDHEDRSVSLDESTYFKVVKIERRSKALQDESGIERYDKLNGFWYLQGSWSALEEVFHCGRRITRNGDEKY